jgi:hypothetical protein
MRSGAGRARSVIFERISVFGILVGRVGPEGFDRQELALSARLKM